MNKESNKANSKECNDTMQIFGIRHFSPMRAHHLINFLNDKKPKLVLIEAPSDFNEFIQEIEIVL